MKLLRPLALMLALSTPAAAFIPGPECAVDEATGALYPATDPRGTLFVDVPLGWEGGMVSYEWLGADGRMLGVVQHCPTDATVVYVIAYDRFQGLRTRLHEMLGSDTVHGFDDVMNEVRQSGGRAQVQNRGPGRCACEVRGF